MRAGLDIGCGANCIYPLLGAAINGWRFVGVDVTQLALEQAAQNVALNPHLAHLITVRLSNSCTAAQAPHAVASRQAGQQQQPRAAPGTHQTAAGGCNAAQALGCGQAGQQQGTVSNNMVAEGTGTAALTDPQGSGLQSIAGAAKGHSLTASRGEAQSSGAGKTAQHTAHEFSTGSDSDAGSADGVLLPAVLPEESFSFSMCNPPFFSSMAEAGLNPSTAHGGGHRAVSAACQFWSLRELAASKASQS